MRNLGSTVSEALTGVRVKISDVYFVIALAKGDQDAARNLDLMQTRAWFDFPLLLNDNRIAKLVFQKSTKGGIPLPRMGALDARLEKPLATEIVRALDDRREDALELDLPSDDRARSSAPRSYRRRSQRRAARKRVFLPPTRIRGRLASRLTRQSTSRPSCLGLRLNRRIALLSRLTHPTPPRIVTGRRRARRPNRICRGRASLSQSPTFSSARRIEARTIGRR